ncbi:hypothetical protein GF312_08650 [Candidatus Poribacteria bacterium]|nr:hypothetical protein [Candidatus Poribacteria bacterium]
MVGKKKEFNEQKSISNERKANVRLSKLKYIAEHRTTRKRITAVDTLQSFLTGWIVHRNIASTEHVVSELSFSIFDMKYLLNLGREKNGIEQKKQLQ